jgi:dolichyl-phosphate-mannose--protein O-mannosyl transferase
MELQFYYYIAYFFGLLFFGYIFYLLIFKIDVKTILQNTIDHHYIKEEAEKCEKNGLKPFPFENGAIVIYAKTQLRAMLKYKRLKKQAISTKKSKKQ